jgi:hypothetical protein
MINYTYPNDAAFSTLYNKGLTKREYFAALAMQGMLANSYGDGYNMPLSRASSDEIAVMSAFQADSLIKALNETAQQEP